MNVGGIETVALDVADGPPLLLTVCPVKVCLVDVPDVFVTVRVTVYIPSEL